MKLAFLNKNFKALSTEDKVVCLTNVGTLLLCLFPWYTEYPAYGDGVWKNVFGGPSFLIGTLIFLLALVIVAYFADQLFEPPRVTLPFSKNYLFLVVGIQQIVLLVLIWSVLQYTADQAYNAEVRFGLFATFLLQFASIVASVLGLQHGKKKQVQDFFQNPKPTPKPRVPMPTLTQTQVPVPEQPISQEQKKTSYKPQNLLDK